MTPPRGTSRILLSFMPVFLPLAVRWVERQERRILAHGEALSEAGQVRAAMVGVAHPERIRVEYSKTIFGPRHPILSWCAQITGLYQPGTTGVSYRYGILIRRDQADNPDLLAHECVHTGQYERLGGIAPFLKAYFQECLTVGYPSGALEQEAIMRGKARPNPG